MGAASLILLDTHIWIWFNLEPRRLPHELVQLLDLEDTELAISAVSVWEIVLGVQRGRIASPISAEATARAWLEASPIEVVPIEKEIAILSRTLAFEHEDPADRFIGATAFHLDCLLATVDTRLSGLPWLKVMPSTAG